MAKLNGVTTVDMIGGEITKIAFEGEEYTKVGGAPKSGDVMYETTGGPDVTSGAYYKVVALDEDNHPRFIDDDGAFNGVYLGRANVTPNVYYRKVPAEVSPPFAELITSKVEAVEKRVSALEVAKPTQELAEGMRVKALRNGQFAYIGAGECGKVTETYEGASDPYNVRVESEGSEGIGDYFRPQDLEIVSKDEDETLKVGDYVVFTKVYCEHKVGKVSVIRELDFPSFLPYGLNTPQGESDGWAKANVIRKATEAEVSEASRTVVKATAPTKPTTGDIVVITGNSNLSRNKVGDIGKVGRRPANRDVEVDVPGRTEGYGNWTKYDEMRHATDAEKAEYETDVKAKPFEIGDYAKVITKVHEHRIGDIVKIKSRDSASFDFEVDRIGHGYYGYIDAKNIEKLSESDAVFAKAGRKPNEYKKGDVVRYLGRSPRKDSLAEVVRDSDGVYVQIEMEPNRFAPKSTEILESVEIVCFAEDRKDNSKGGR